MRRAVIIIAMFGFSTFSSLLMADVLYSEEIKATEFILGNTLEWSTLIEFDVSEFVIEKSTDGRYFYEIGNLEGSGYSLVDKKYHFLDLGSIFKKSYYRLREISKKGMVGYSNTTFFERTVVNNVNVLAISSPEVASTFTITLDALEFGKIELKLTNSFNQTLFQRTEELIAGVNHKTIDFSDLGKGIYYIYLKSEKSERKFRITKTTDQNAVRTPVASSILFEKQ